MGTADDSRVKWMTFCLITEQLSTVQSLGNSQSIFKGYFNSFNSVISSCSNCLHNLEGSQIMPNKLYLPGFRGHCFTDKMQVKAS